MSEEELNLVPPSETHDEYDPANADRGTQTPADQVLALGEVASATVEKPPAVEEKVPEVRPFFEHPKTPVTMRNFLLRSMPERESEKVLKLRPWQAALLTHQLLDLYRGMDLPELSDEGLEERCALIERLVGLYGFPQAAEEIAKCTNEPRKTVLNRIDRVVALLNTRLSDNRRAALLRRAAATPRPVQDPGA